MGNLSRPKFLKENESVINSLQKQKTVSSYIFIGEFYKILKEEIYSLSDISSRKKNQWEHF